MIVQTYFPQKLSRSRYDAYLASGWFRGSVMLYKMDLLCMEKDVFSVVNIRLNILNFSYKKRHQKLLKKNNERFVTVVNPAQPNAEKEALYQSHKSRFKGFIHGTLDEYLHSGHHQTVFNTSEICVYDGDRLVAVSYFDVGEKSIASLLALYHPDYHAYSLGIYTMLKEVEHGIKLEKKWYYPGYVLDRPSSFNYKLSLGQYEHYNANKRWSSMSKFNSSDTIGFHLKKKLETLHGECKSEGIEMKRWLYPYFSMGYMGYWNIDFVKHPLFYEIPYGAPGTSKLMVAYDLDDEVFSINVIDHADAHDHLINMEISHEFMSDPSYFMELMMVRDKIFSSSDVSAVVEKIRHIINGVPHRHTLLSPGLEELLSGSY
jgi:arginyl-tRNA--protein-N-Asp/Glu arginylyltransferase